MFFEIRNKIDQTIEGAEAEGEDVEATLDKIRGQFNDKIYLICGRLNRQNRHEMPAFMDALKEKILHAKIFFFTDEESEAESALEG